VKEDEMGRACSMNWRGEERNAFMILVGKLEKRETTRKTRT
jgi:hypothetical protein